MLLPYPRYDTAVQTLARRTLAIMSNFDKDRFHSLIKEEKSWYRMPSMVHLYLLLLARTYTPEAIRKL